MNLNACCSLCFGVAIYGNDWPLINGMTMKGKVNIRTVPTTPPEMKNAISGNGGDDDDDDDCGSNNMLNKAFVSSSSLWFTIGEAASTLVVREIMSTFLDVAVAVTDRSSFFSAAVFVMKDDDSEVTNDETCHHGGHIYP